MTNTYINSSIQFKIKSYMRLAEMTPPDDVDQRQYYIDRAAELLETQDMSISSDDEQDNYKIGLIGEYLKNKSRVCLYQIWRDAIHHSVSPPVMKRRDSLELASIVCDFYKWKRGNTEIFTDIGRQKAFYAPNAEEQHEPGQRRESLQIRTC